MPTNILGKVPTKPLNIDQRPREFLYPEEMEELINAAGKTGRHRLRDKTLILLAYRHALRVCETIALRWDCVDWKCSTIYVHRKKNGLPSIHPLRNVEVSHLRRLSKLQSESPYIFCSERGGMLSTDAVRKIFSRAGAIANIPFPVHPHMARHSCGYYLANCGQDTRSIQAYMGHVGIMNTVKYTQLAPGRFDLFWRD